MNNDINKFNEQNTPVESTSMPAVEPTPMPAVEPTPMPAVEPTPMPAVEPTPMPAVEPTPMPAVEPTPMPAVEPTSMQAVEPTPMPAVEPTSMQAVEPTPMQAVESTPTTDVNPMEAVSNLNKDEAMEEALSHTNQYSPFEAPKQEVNKETKKTNNKSAYIFIGIIFAIMLLFIIFLPQISKLFGW